jgi:ferredoxin
MNNVVFYFSGTGNALWAGRTVAQELGACRLFPMASGEHAVQAKGADSVGLFFPVHIWGVPGLVLDFVSRLKVEPETYLYAVAVNAGQVSRTLIQLAVFCRKAGMNLAAGVEVKLPSNYIPWGGPGDGDEIANRISRARTKLEEVAIRFKNKERWGVERGPLWQRILFTALYRLSFGQVPGMDKKFTVDEACNGCAICVRVCPVANIDLHENRPRWHHRCTQCLACLQWCPQKAIQMGARTSGYDRYHHPEVLLRDVLFEDRSPPPGQPKG